MDIKPIRTDEDHQHALVKISRLMERAPAEGSPEGDRLDILATLVESYEATRHPIGLPDSIAAISARMADKGLSADDLDALLGRRGRTADLLAGRRAPTVPTLRVLSRALDLPAEILLQPYRRPIAAE